MGCCAVLSQCLPLPHAAAQYTTLQQHHIPFGTDTLTKRANVIAPQYSTSDILDGVFGGSQVALSFGTLGPRLYLVACPSPTAPRHAQTSSNFFTPKTKPEMIREALDYGDLGCSPPWRAGGGGLGSGARGEEGQGTGRDSGSGGGRSGGLGVPASTGRLVIGESCWQVYVRVCATFVVGSFG